MEHGELLQVFGRGAGRDFAASEDVVTISLLAMSDSLGIGTMGAASGNTTQADGSDVPYTTVRQPGGVLFRHL